MTQFHVWLRAEVGGSTQNCCGLVVGSVVGGGKTTMSLVKATQLALALVVTSLLIADPVASQVTGSDTAIIQIRPDTAAEYCDERVCVCVSPRSYRRNCTSDLHPIFMHINHGRGSVTLCTSDCMVDVIFVHKPRLLDVAAQLKRSAHAALGLVANRHTGLLFGRLK